MNRNKNCRFCEIVKNRENEYIVYENDHILVLLDKYRRTSLGGTCLVIPKGHYESFLDTPFSIDLELISVLKRIGQLVKLAYKAKGIRIWSAIGKSAGQSIFHCHFHVVPCNSLYDRLYAVMPGLIDKIKGLINKKALKNDQLEALLKPLTEEISKLNLSITAPTGKHPL